MKVYAILEKAQPELANEIEFTSYQHTPIVCDNFVDLQNALIHLNKCCVRVGDYVGQFVLRDFTVELDTDSYQNSEVKDWEYSAKSYFKNKLDSFFEKPLSPNQFDIKNHIIDSINSNQEPITKNESSFNLSKEFSPLLTSTYYDLYYKEYCGGSADNSGADSEIEKYYLYVLLEDLYNEERTKRQQNKKK